MKTSYIEGTNECYACNYPIEWSHSFSMPISGMEVHAIKSVNPEAIAVGKDEDGNIKFEIICKCPKCQILNKFITFAK